MKACDESKAHYCPNPSKYQVRLYRTLKEIGIDSQLQHWTGREHISIAILPAKLYIVVDVDRASSRVKLPVEKLSGRDGITGTGFKTLFFSHQEISENALQVARSIEMELKDRQDLS